MRWNWWYSFFLFISKTTCPSPKKSGGRDTQCLLGYVSAIFSFLDGDDLLPQHYWLCHRQPNNKKTLKNSVDLNSPRVRCYILFYLTFMQLFIHNYNPVHPLFILLKDRSLRVLATQHLAQDRHPYYASCIVSISSVFFGAEIKLPQISFGPVIHDITLGIKLPQISFGPEIHGITLGIKLPQILFGPVIHGITLARLTLILKATSTEKHVRRLKAFLRKLIVRLQSGDIKKKNSQFLLLMHAILFERPVPKFALQVWRIKQHPFYSTLAA